MAVERDFSLVPLPVTSPWPRAKREEDYHERLRGWPPDLSL